MMLSTSPILGQQFAYGFGRIGVLQQHFLSQGDIDRLLGAHDDQQLLQIVGELDLAHGIEPTTDPRELTVRMERHFQAEVRAMAGADHREIFDILWLPNDGALLAYLLKKHYGLTSAISVEPLAGSYAYPPQALQSLIETGKTSADLPRSLTEFVLRMRARFGATPQVIDDSVSQYVIEEQLRLAKKSGSRLILRYIQHQIDLKNIRTARRLRPEDDPKTHLMVGGRIPVADLSADPKKLASLIQSSHLPSELADSLGDSDEASVALERGLARAMARDISAMRERVLSMEAVFAFAIIMQSQIRVLRTIAIGKSMKLKAEEITQLLPPFFSASPFVS